MHELHSGSLNDDSDALGLDRSTPPSTIRQPPFLNCPYVDPPPYLDVLSFHSTRLLPVSHKEIKARELQQKAKKDSATHSKASKLEEFTPEEEVARLDELLASVHLLLEPIQLPDLSHTGVFDPATSLLRPVTSAASIPKPGNESVTKLKLSKLDKSDEVKLFYPTGAKNSNMREVIKETIQKHFSTTDLEHPLSDQTLGISASAPNFFSTDSTANVRTVVDSDGNVRSISPSKVRGLGKAPKKRNKLNAIKSPVKESLAPSGFLNPHLTRQAKDVIAAVRANSSKINDLIS